MAESKQQLSNAESGDEKAAMEFTDMCDNVIDIILCNLELDDLANVSDTDQRPRNIAASVFSRKYTHRLMSFDAFHHSYEMTNERIEAVMQDHFVYYIKIPIIRIHDAKIRFKLLRNFGKFIKFIRIQCDFLKSNEFRVKIQTAMKNLFEYVLEYCTDSVKVLEMHYYPFFTLTAVDCAEHEIAIGIWKNWDADALRLMPNIRNHDLTGVPTTLEHHFPHLKHVRVNTQM